MWVLPPLATCRAAVATAMQADIDWDAAPSEGEHK
jgi:hypothetical protein